MLIATLWLVFGLVLLTIGADKFVEGASSLAKKLGMSELVIGLTVVAFGTSAPELVVNVISAWKGEAGLVYGNIIGSNVCNFLLILGVAGMIYPLTAHKDIIKKDLPYSLLAIVALFILVNDVWFFGGTATTTTEVTTSGLIKTHTFFGELSRIDGAILAGLFAFFLYYVFTSASNGDAPSGEEEDVQELSTGLTWFYLLGGMTGLVVGGQLIVDNATFLAKAWGMSDTMIGLTVVAIGTSLPELATSAAAALKKKSDIAIANVVGSNIFNIFFVLSTSSLIAPAKFEDKLNIDIFVVIGGTVLLFLFLLFSRGRSRTADEIEIMDNPELVAKTAKEHVFQRWQGGLFFAAYIVYLGFSIWREME
jgi:cation:H+ antiporter